MKKIILSVLIVIVLLLGGYATYLLKNNTVEKSAESLQNTPKEETITTENISQTPEELADVAIEPETPEEETFTGLLDMDKWHYNAEDKVYYQTGIYYSQASVDSQYQKLALFIPEKYFHCNELKEELFLCEPNSAARINKYTIHTAPIVTEINSPDYAAESALTEYRNFKEYTDAGLIYAHIGFRGVEHGAPAAVTDIKAAIHFMKYNKVRIPGNTDYIFAIGVNQGAYLAAVLATSGNSRLYQPYLQEIGALNGLNDNIKGVMLINPAGSPDTYNEAVEWIFNNTRQGLTDEQKKLANKMAAEYATYINKAGFIGPQGNALTLQYSKKGEYQNGTYHDYIKKTIGSSLLRFMSEHSFPYAIPKSWEISEDKAPFHNNVKLAGTYQTRYKFFEDLNSQKRWITDTENRGILVSNLDEFNKIFSNKQPPFASVDNLDKKETENLLFGTGNGERLHFDTYMAKALKNTPQEKEFVTDLYKRDKIGYNTAKRLDMYNPLYYIMPSYEGYKTSMVAPYWYIRNGLFQKSNILTSAINLFLAINSYLKGSNIDYATIWGMGDVEKISPTDRTNFINWINKI